MDILVPTFIWKRNIQESPRTLWNRSVWNERSTSCYISRHTTKISKIDHLGLQWCEDWGHGGGLGWSQWGPASRQWLVPTDASCPLEVEEERHGEESEAERNRQGGRASLKPSRGPVGGLPTAMLAFFPVVTFWCEQRLSSKPQGVYGQPHN